MDENRRNETTVTYHHRDAQSDIAPSYTSTLFVQLQQLQKDLQVQYQNEKHELTTLNDRFRHFIDRVQKLEAANAKYLAQLANYRGPPPDFGGADIEWNERYLHLQSDLTAINHGMLDFGLEVEMYQLQAAIYQQLIDVEQQYKDDRHIKLEQELNQTSAALNSLRVSNAELGREVENLFTARDDAYKQYLRLTHEWSRLKKQSKEWDLNKQLLKNQIAFYKSLRSHAAQSVYNC